MDEQASGNFGLNLGAGMVIGILLGLGASTVYARRAAREARAGWNLVPIIVAADDLKPGAVVTYDELAQRAIPEQFVTASTVRPDQANQLVGQELTIPLHAGDPIFWAVIARAPAPDAGAPQPR